MKVNKIYEKYYVIFTIKLISKIRKINTFYERTLKAILRFTVCFAIKLGDKLCFLNKLISFIYPKIVRLSTCFLACKSTFDVVFYLRWIYFANCPHTWSSYVCFLRKSSAIATGTNLPQYGHMIFWQSKLFEPTLISFISSINLPNDLIDLDSVLFAQCVCNFHFL